MLNFKAWNPQIFHMEQLKKLSGTWNEYYSMVLHIFVAVTPFQFPLTCVKTIWYIFNLVHIILLYKQLHWKNGTQLGYKILQRLCVYIILPTSIEKQTNKQKIFIKIRQRGHAGILMSWNWIPCILKGRNCHSLGL